MQVVVFDIPLLDELAYHISILRVFFSGRDALEHGTG